MADSITELKDKISNLRNRMSTLREKTEGTPARAQRLATSAAGAYIYGKLEADARAESREMQSIAGLDPMLTWGVAAAFAADYVGGRWGEMLGDAGVGIVSAFAYKQGVGT